MTIDEGEIWRPGGWFAHRPEAQAFTLELAHGDHRGERSEYSVAHGKDDKHKHPVRRTLLFPGHHVPINAVVVGVGEVYDRSNERLDL